MFTGGKNRPRLAPVVKAIGPTVLGTTTHNSSKFDFNSTSMGFEAKKGNFGARQGALSAYSRGASRRTEPVKPNRGLLKSQEGRRG